MTTFIEFLNKTQIALEKCHILNFEGQVDICIPFAISPGIHKIKVPGMDPFIVLCGSAATGPGWIVVQQRIDGKENFYRNWYSYWAGFGSLNADFFLGLEKIHRVTANRRDEHYMHVETFKDEILYATYDSSAIAGERDQCKVIRADGFSANLSELYVGLEFHEGYKFFTIDRDDSEDNAKKFGGTIQLKTILGK